MAGVLSGGPLSASSTPKRGEVYWADLSPTRGSEQAGRRPVLVISHDALNVKSGTIIALAITSRPQRAGFPLTHKLDSGGLPKDSWVKLSQVRTISTERLGERIGAVEPEELAEIVEGLIELVA